MSFPMQKTLLLFWFVLQSSGVFGTSEDRTLSRFGSTKPPRRRLVAASRSNGLATREVFQDFSDEAEFHFMDGGSIAQRQHPPMNSQRL